MGLPTYNDVHIDRALTDLSVAYFQEAPPVSSRLFLPVSVDNKTDKYWIWDKADFWRDDMKIRAPGTKFVRIGMRLSTDSFSCDEYAEEYPIPDENAGNADAVIRLSQTGTRLLTSRIGLRKDRAFATDFMKTGVWGTDLVGTSGFTKWSDATSDPSGNVLTAAEAILNALGDTYEEAGMRLVALCGSIVVNRLKNHPDAIDRIKYTQAATPAAVNQTLAAWLGLDELVVGRRRYTTSAEGATDAYAPVFDDDMLVVAVPSAPSPETPAAGYTFAWNEGGRGDMYVEQYRDETVKSDIVRAVTHFDQKLVASTLGYFFSDCVD